MFPNPWNGPSIRPTRPNSQQNGLSFVRRGVLSPCSPYYRWWMSWLAQVYTDSHTRVRVAGRRPRWGNVMARRYAFAVSCDDAYAWFRGEIWSSDGTPMWVAFHFQRRFPFFWLIANDDVLVPTDRSLASRRHGSHVQISATHLVSGLSIATLMMHKIIFIFHFIISVAQMSFPRQRWLFYV